MSHGMHNSTSFRPIHIILLSLVIGSFSISIFGQEPLGSHAGGAAASAKRAEVDRKIPLISRKPYFRFGLLKDRYVGGLGRCSATAIDMRDLGVSTEKLGRGCVQLALTAKHCIEDASKEIADAIAEDHSKIAQSMCVGKGFKGIKTQLDLSLPQGRTDAILIEPLDKTSKSDLGLIAIPCGEGMESFKLADNSDSAPTKMELWRPYSEKMRGLSENVSMVRNLQRTVSLNGGSASIQTSDSKMGLYNFDGVDNTQQGDSGSPGFIDSNGVKKIAAVLTGSSNDKEIGGTLMTAGLGLNGASSSAKADLKKDVQKMVEGVDCGGFINSFSNTIADRGKTEGLESSQLFQQPRNNILGF
jgi:hypothetical protein